MEKFCYLAGTIGARVGAFDSVLTRIRSGCCKLKNLVLLFASRNTFPVKKEDVIRLERNDSRMARWICTVRPQQRISTEELRASLKLNSLRECLRNRRLQLFSYLERMEESTRSNKSKTFKVTSSFPRGRPMKTWN